MKLATTASGSRAISADNRAIGSGNDTTPPFRLAMTRMIRAAAASAVMRNGVAEFMGVMAVWTYPGQIVVTVIPLVRRNPEALHVGVHGRLAGAIGGFARQAFERRQARNR